jgi:large subunit ribosomal protein L24
MEKIKVGDSVKVIQGDDKGKIGKVKTILRNKGKVIVEGVNIKIKHVKPSQKDKVGKIINFNAPIHISNIMLCAQNGLISKVSFIFKDDKKIRVLRKTNELLQ